MMDSTTKQHLTTGEYSSTSSTRKINLLLQRSFRYSYRKRSCICCPTILCELLFPIIIIILLVLIHYDVESTSKVLHHSVSLSLYNGQCSQSLDPKTTSSNDLLNNCFRHSTSYGGFTRNFFRLSPFFAKVNLIFHPMSSETRGLVKYAERRFQQMGCDNIKVWSQTINNENDADFLENRILIDFGSISNLKKKRNLHYNIIVPKPAMLPKTDPVDMSFILFSHPASIADRHEDGQQFPAYSDMKIFIDSLLIDYQTNKNIQYELEKTSMICTPSRRNLIFMSTRMAGWILNLIDVIFIIPYILLLTALIEEKNAKVKEILKVLGIQPILNNFAHAIRTLIILCLLTTSLCIVLKLKPYGYFETVNFGFLLCGYFIFAVQLISFCIMIAQLFDKTVRAHLTVIAIWVISSNIYSYIVLWPTSIQYILIFFSPHIAVYSIFQQAVLHDLAEKDISLFQSIYRYVPMPFPTLIVMICSCIFYWFLSWYFEKVFPGEYGIPVGWNFLFKRDYWRSEKFDRHPESLPQHDMLLSRRNSTGTAIVHVNNLVKKFGPDKTAVDNVSFDLYENQITSLVGPNGSGKTTIFNCLIGIYRQTSGTINIESDDGMYYDTRDNMEMLRKSMGYCPQHDILFDLLTIKEQIEFYAIARGFGKSKEQIANEMLKVVDLEMSKNHYCKSLSGGMKRRLSLACAFVGNTKIVLLDEPSSGLDPSTRRSLWDWLRSMKEGKTLLLTTHFMEESDALSDRVMIISNAQIKADGTSTKLKEIYGSGYKLIINKQNEYNTNDIKNELSCYLPELKIESDVLDGNIVFRTNQQPNQQFIQALHHLEKMKKENRIKNYGVQNSTLDDVFVKITKDINVHNQSEAIAVDTETLEQQCQRVFNNPHVFTGIRYYLSQFYGLLIKTSLVRCRRWALTLAVLLIPILHNLLSNLTTHNQSESGIFQMNLNALSPQTILYHVDPSIEKYFQASTDGAILQQGSRNISQMNLDIRQKRIDRPYTYTDIYIGFNIPKPIGNRYKIQALSSNLISGYEVVSLASNTIYKHALNDSSASIHTTLIYKQMGNSTTKRTLHYLSNLVNIASCFFKFLPFTLITDIYIFYILFFYVTVFLISERKDSFLSLLNISGLHPASYWLFTYLFDIVISVIWFCYLLGVYSLFHIAFNGLSNKSSETEDFVSMKFISAWDLRIQFYPLTILIILPTLPFTYLLTKMFKSDINGGMLIWLSLTVFHAVSIFVRIRTMAVTSPSVRLILCWLLNILSPTINSQVIVTYILLQKSTLCTSLMDSFPVLLSASIGDDTIAWNCVTLVLHIVLYLLLIIIIDCGLLKFTFSCLYKSNFNENTLDDDVLAERSRILNSHTKISDDDDDDEYTDYLTVNDLVKYYPRRSVVAINHLTFGAKRGEAFGLLGFNGAGKTGTFRVMVGDLISTQGTAYIDGLNVQHRIRSTRNLGYCPQENCSMEFLTVEDSLYLLARIRGVHSSHIKSIVETISSLVLLDPFRKNYIHQLSGATKRRLHAAIALIGPPLVAILDEPTTGVDPNARQQMQDIFLNAVKAKLTIILTSHSMDECERVCNRLGIMAEGQLACLGTIQHLKSKFGQGYTIEIKVRSTSNDPNQASISDVQSFLLSQTKYHVETKETTHTTGLFQISQATPAELFELIEENKQRLNIETYTISQTTLEQIFLSFGKQMQSV